MVIFTQPGTNLVQYYGKMKKLFKPGKTKLVRIDHKTDILKNYNQEKIISENQIRKND
jgi:hypothetical protein